MFSVFITPEAEMDVYEAGFWYEFKRSGLEKEFFICIEASVNLITRNPFLFEVLCEEEIRKVNTKRFPYGIYYYIDKKRIVILGVLNLKDNPDKWKSRKLKS